MEKIQHFLPLKSHSLSHITLNCLPHVEHRKSLRSEWRSMCNRSLSGLQKAFSQCGHWKIFSEWKQRICFLTWGGHTVKILSTSFTLISMVTWENLTKNKTTVNLWSWCKCRNLECLEVDVRRNWAQQVLQVPEVALETGRNYLSSMQSSNVSVSIGLKSTDQTVEPIKHRRTLDKQKWHQCVTLTTPLLTWIKSVNVFLQMGQPKHPSTAWTPTWSFSSSSFSNVSGHKMQE